MRIRFRTPSPTTGTVQVVKPGGKLIVTLARDSYLKRYHFPAYYWDGRTRRRRHRSAGPLQAAGETAGPGPRPGAARHDQLHHAKRIRADCRPRVGSKRERLPRRRRGAGLAAAGAAGAILLPAGRLRSLAMLAALVLFPVLILGDQWHSHQIADLRHSAGRLVALGSSSASRRRCARLRLQALAGPPATGDRRRAAVPGALHSGGDTANLLVPLYLVIAGGVRGDWRWREVRLAASRPEVLRDRTAGKRSWLPRILAAVVLLYAVQVLYSEDFSKGLQNVCFFFVPFTLVYGLLRDVEWDRRLLAWSSGWLRSRRSASFWSARSSREPRACSGTTR